LLAENGFNPERNLCKRLSSAERRALLCAISGSSRGAMLRAPMHGRLLQRFPLGLMNWHRIPRVVRSSQPWAERPYPFGVNPIPAAPPEKQKAVERLVDRILAAKHNS